MKPCTPPRPARGSAPRPTFAPGPAHSTGLTLIEVMIALLLGLIVIGAAVAIFLSNRQAYQAGESLGRISERVRNGFEFIAADLRAAGATPCGGDADTASRIGTNWWGQWQPGGLRGYAATAALPGVAFGTAAGARQSGTAALQLQSADDDGIRTTTASTAGTTLLAVNTSSGLETGQLAVICDFTHTPQLFKTAAVSGNAVTAAWGSGIATAWNTGALIGRYRAVQWYLGANDHGGSSLYRRRLRVANNAPAPQSEEMVDGVSALQLRYRTAAADAPWQTADAVPDWSAVAAVELTLTYTGTDARVGANGQPLTRSVRQVVELRNHNHG